MIYPVSNTQKGLPFIVWAVFIFSGLALIGRGELLGYRMSGWGWFGPFVLSILVISANPTRIRFPIKIWLPWIFWVAIYQYLSPFPSLQRSIQLLCPIIVGMAVSTANTDEVRLANFLNLCKIFAVFIVIIVIWYTGILFTGTLPSTMGLAPQVMTIILLCTIFATSYSIGNKLDIKWWWAMVVIPVIAVTRTAILVSLLTLPLTYAKMKISYRLKYIIVIFLVSLTVFYMPRFQHKMFKSGQGEIRDVLGAGIRDHGRRYMSEMFIRGVENSPWLGHGAGSGEVYARIISNGLLAYPHNDWLLQLYDYGVLGTSIFIWCAVFCSFHAYRISLQYPGKIKLLFLAGASSFVSLFLMMFTDNILVYASYFGNFQFTILGMAYAATSNTNKKITIKSGYSGDGAGSK